MTFYKEFKTKILAPVYLFITFIYFMVIARTYDHDYEIIIMNNQMYFGILKVISVIFIIHLVLSLIYEKYILIILSYILYSILYLLQSGKGMPANLNTTEEIYSAFFYILFYLNIFFVLFFIIIFAWKIIKKRKTT